VYFLVSILRFCVAGAGLLLCSVALVLSGFTLYLGPQLPKIQSIKDMKLQTPLRIYTRDAKLMGEFGETRRQPISYSDIPPLFVKAVLAAEDDRFFTHPGIDATGLLRAAAELVKSGRIQSGGSTITMQLARNFFLSTDKSFIRKFNEILLSIQLERTFSKEQIFELYANKIYLGNYAYGSQAAAYIYYGRPLNELSLAEWAMLAGLPKAPSKYNPIANPERATIRRDWILGRMQLLGYITPEQYSSAIIEPVEVHFHGLKTDIDSPYAAELARQFALEKLGASAYTDGYNVFTTFDSRLQLIARKSVWEGVTNYDQRHGYRGAEKNLTLPADNQDSKAWKTLFSDLNTISDLEPAVVTAVKKDHLQARLKSGKWIDLHWNAAISKSLQAYKSENYLAPPPSSFTMVFKQGDVIRLRTKPDNTISIGQLPHVQAALVAINAENGAVLAISGGSDYQISKFNRATQALRQPGSNFKPFVYIKALESGYTPATLINDAPLVFHEAGMAEPWRPANASDEYLGPTRLRKALYESRNMVSIRILQNLGVKTVIDSLTRFGFDTRQMAPNLSLALGSHAVTPLTLANAYATLANGGYKVDAFWVSRIEDSTGKIVYENHPNIVCQGCPDDGLNQHQAVRVVDEQSAFIIDDILKDVIRKGTGRNALVLNRKDIAGKTGTTNGPTDAWFSGYNPAIATTTWMGFDGNTYLGKKEYGGTAALPIWIDFMQEALKDTPEIERVMPPGLVTLRIDPKTGEAAPPDSDNAIFEFFRADKLPVSAESQEWLDSDQQQPNHHEPTVKQVTEELF
jgi:penicillin-binding protein 1A